LLIKGQPSNLLALSWAIIWCSPKVRKSLKSSKSV
jgi:hypothetical protein